MSASVEISSYQGTIPMSDYREKINKKKKLFVFSCCAFKKSLSKLSSSCAKDYLKRTIKQNTSTRIRRL